MKKTITKSAKETFDRGFALAEGLKGGETLALIGDLGAGKTKFIQGLAKGLGVKEKVNSPTFNILKVYKVRRRGKIKNFFHIDAYRLRSGKDLRVLGIDEILASPESVVAIEWADKVRAVWPRDTKVISLKPRGEKEREIAFK